MAWRDIAETVFVLGVAAKVAGDALAVTVLAATADGDETARYDGVTSARAPACVLPGSGARARVVHALGVLGVVAFVLQPPVSIAMGGGGMADVLLGANLLAGYGIGAMYLVDGLAAVVD